MNWEQIKKIFPDEYADIQSWFNERTGTNSKLPFWKQPIWQNDLVMLALMNVHGIEILIDAKFAAEQKMFRYIYLIVLSETERLEPVSHYNTRIHAEYNAYVHCFKHIQDARKKNTTAKQTIAQA